MSAWARLKIGSLSTSTPSQSKITRSRALFIGGRLLRRERPSPIVNRNGPVAASGAHCLAQGCCRCPVPLMRRLVVQPAAVPPARRVGADDFVPPALHPRRGVPPRGAPPPPAAGDFVGEDIAPPHRHCQF